MANDARVEMDYEERPKAGVVGEGGESDEWARRSAAERLSAAGRAPHARDRILYDGDAVDGNDTGGQRPFGVLFNPKGFPWTEQECNVHWGESARLESLRDKWYGKAFVGDGADAVDRSELDPWQKFAHDVVMDSRHELTQPLRMMLLGSAGTGKSRTARCFVGSRRSRVRDKWSQALQRARLRGRGRGVSASHRGRRVAVSAGDLRRQNVTEWLGVPAEEAAAAVEAYDAAQKRTLQKKQDANVAAAEEEAVAIV